MPKSPPKPDAPGGSPGPGRLAETRCRGCGALATRWWIAPEREIFGRSDRKTAFGYCDAHAPRSADADMVDSNTVSVWETLES